MVLAVIDSGATELAALKMRCAEPEAAQEVRRNNIYLDSGSSTSINADVSHFDPHTSPSFCRAGEPHGAETANQMIMLVGAKDKLWELVGK